MHTTPFKHKEKCLFTQNTYKYGHVSKLINSLVPFHDSLAILLQPAIQP